MADQPQAHSARITAALLDAKAERERAEREEWVRTHCYHCSEQLPARATELMDKILFEGDLSEAEMTELNRLGCSNRCFEEES